MAAVPVHQDTSVGFAPATDRRQAVLLCTELRGLARMSDALNPSLVLFLANEFFSFVADVVTAHGGEAITSHHEMLLSAFTRGNAIQVSQQAVRAAQRVQADFPAVADKWRTTYGLKAAVAQGLHMGEAVIGLAGPRGQEHRVAFGDSVHVAQCMLNRARAGEFVMTEALLGALAIGNLDLHAEALPQLELPRRPPITIYGVLVDERLDFT